MCLQGSHLKSYRGYAMKNFMNAMYAFNIILQAFWSLLFPIGAGVLIGWLLTEKCGMKSYVFVILIVLGALTGIYTLAALPITSAFIMVVVSVALTLISGLIPANAAAKKDPVIALRTE